MKWMMKKPNIIVLAMAIAFILLLTSYAAGIWAYMQYQKKAAYFDEKIAYLDGFNKFLGDRFVEMEKKLEKIKFNLEVAANTSETRRREILGRIEAVRQDIERWQTEYKLGLSELKKEYFRKVDLGEISVGK